MYKLKQDSKNKMAINRRVQTKMYKM